MRLEAEGVQRDGYVVDFGDIKTVARKLCKDLNELFLCPERSDVMHISTANGTLTIKWCASVLQPAPIDKRATHDHASILAGTANSHNCLLLIWLSKIACCCCFDYCLLSTSEDGAVFSFPAKDAAMLPITHSTVEELAHYFCSKIIESYTMARLLARGITVIHVTVSEAPGQDATYSRTFKHNRGAAGLPVSPRDWRSIAPRTKSPEAACAGNEPVGKREQSSENGGDAKRPKR